MSIIERITSRWVMRFFLSFRLPIFGEKEKGVLVMETIQRTKQILLKESLEGG
ncbi:MAG: hypothetical protein ABS922_13755 [Psychrobacillus psychrotolerans]